MEANYDFKEDTTSEIPDYDYSQDCASLDDCSFISIGSSQPEEKGYVPKKTDKERRFPEISETSLKYYYSKCNKKFPSNIKTYRKEIEQDLIKARKYYEEIKQNDGEAFFCLAYIYEWGLGEALESIPKACEYLEKACKYRIGDLNKADAYLSLGWLYELKVEPREQETKKEIKKKAFNCFQKAAKLGKAYALFKLGVVYHRWKINDKRAFDRAKQAAELGVPEGQYLLGVYYYKGIGTDRKVEEAIYWLEKAAEKKHYADHELGLIYELEKNLPKARTHYQKAANRGFRKSEEALQRLVGY